MRFYISVNKNPFMTVKTHTDAWDEIQDLLHDACIYIYSSTSVLIIYIMYSIYNYYYYAAITIDL